MGKHKHADERISRGDFLKKGAALGVGASALGGLGGEDLEAQEIVWDHEADFVTIGAGTAGLAGAVSALYMLAENMHRILGPVEMPPFRHRKILSSDPEERKAEASFILENGAEVSNHCQ